MIAKLALWKNLLLIPNYVVTITITTNGNAVEEEGETAVGRWAGGWVG